MMSLEHGTAILIAFVGSGYERNLHEFLSPAQDRLRLLDAVYEIAEHQDHKEIEPANRCVRAIGCFLGVLVRISVFGACLLASMHVVLRLLRPHMPRIR